MILMPCPKTAFAASCLIVHSYKINPEHEIYEPFGTFTDAITLDEPWHIEIPIATLRPRHL